TGDASLDFLLRAWIWPEPGDWPILAMLGVSAAIGSLLVAQGYRLCEAALAAPFEYTAMPLAVFWGVVVFGDWPDPVSWTGIALILAGGLYLIWRETRRGLETEGPRARRCSGVSFPGAPARLARTKGMAGMAEERAVVFDIGNVLIEWQPEQFYDHAIGREARTRMFAEVDLHGMNEAVDRGAP